MVTKSAPVRRTRHARPIYHEVQPGGTSRGNPVHEPIVRGESIGLGSPTWICVAIVTLLLIDSFAWQGFYRHMVLMGMEAQGKSIRAWSEHVWL